MMGAYEASWTKYPAEPACVPVFNTRAVLIVAVVLHPASGLLLNPIIASVAMNLSSIPVVVGNAFREMAQATCCRERKSVAKTLQSNGSRSRIRFLDPPIAGRTIWFVEGV